MSLPCWAEHYFWDVTSSLSPSSRSSDLKISRREEERVSRGCSWMNLKTQDAVEQPRPTFFPLSSPLEISSFLRSREEKRKGKMKEKRDKPSCCPTIGERGVGHQRLSVSFSFYFLLLFRGERGIGIGRRYHVRSEPTRNRKPILLSTVWLGFLVGQSHGESYPILSSFLSAKARKGEREIEKPLIVQTFDPQLMMNAVRL